MIAPSISAAEQQAARICEDLHCFLATLDTAKAAVEASLNAIDKTGRSAREIGLREASLLVERSSEELAGVCQFQLEANAAFHKARLEFEQIHQQIESTKAVIRTFKAHLEAARIYSMAAWEQMFSGLTPLMMHDAFPELLGPEAVEWVLDLGEAGLDAGDLVVGGLGPGGERGGLGRKSCSLSGSTT